MNKVIFLDFDGVLNTEKYQAGLRAEGKKGYDKYGPLFDPDAVGNLRRILDAVLDAPVVISSSWKMEGLSRMKDMWQFRKMPGSVHDITPDYLPQDWHIDLDTVDDFSILVGRGNEVRQWLKENMPDGCRYVIFDDLPDYLPDQRGHLITTDPRIGISKEDADHAIKVLCG